MSASIMQHEEFQVSVVPPNTPPVEPGAEAMDAVPRVRWFAVYTRSNHEKRVADQFGSRGVQHFLPLYESVRRWKDRHVRLQLPLFPGYLFVRLASQERLRVLQVPGVVRLVGFNGSPAPMADEDLNRIREFLAQGWRAEPHRYLRVGRRARVVRGPLTGMEGIVSRWKNRRRLVVSFDLIQRSMAVELDAVDLLVLQTSN